MAQSTISEGFNSDCPIHHPTEDLLGRDGFAKRLAEQISRWKGTESLVIALYGDWGTGKTSLKNLTLEHLVAERPPITIVEFNPWMVSGEEAIARSFFDEVLACLENLPRSMAQQKRAATWKKYAKGFGMAAKLAGAAEAVGLFVPLLGQVGHTAKTSLERAQELAKTAGDMFGDRPPLAEIRRELRTQFSSLHDPIVVVLDDIDRLTVDEICLVFRLVKANADFPKLIYLLLFQRESAEKALDHISNNRGKDFLQKIVQVGFDLPTPSQQDLNGVLFKKLDLIMEGRVREEDWQAERWANLWVRGMQPYFSNLRESYRFLNSFGFQLVGFHRGGALEVNAVDLIGVETLRVFEPEIHKRISQEEYLLLSMQGETRDHLKQLADEMLSIRRGTEEQVKTILAQLFPSLEGLWNNHGWGDGFQRPWTNARRVCTKAFFNRYFSLETGKEQVTEAEVRQFLAVISHRVKLRTILRRILKQGVILSMLQRLEANDKLDNMRDPAPYLLALVDISDSIHQAERQWLVDTKAYWYVRRAVRRILEPLDEKARVTLLDKLIRDSKALFLPGEWITDMDEDHREDSIYPKRSNEALRPLKSAWLKRVRIAAKSPRRFLTIEGFRRVLRLWLEWGKPDEVRIWIRDLRHASSLLDFIAAFINKSTSQGIGSVYVHDHSWIAWKNSLDQFGNLEHWSNVLASISRAKNLNEAQTRTKRLFHQTMQRWKRGVEDDNPRKFENSFPEKG